MSKLLEMRDNGYTLSEGVNIIDVNYDEKAVRISKDNGKTWEYGVI